MLNTDVYQCTLCGGVVLEQFSIFPTNGICYSCTMKAMNDGE